MLDSSLKLIYFLVPVACLIALWQSAQGAWHVSLCLSLFCSLSLSLCLCPSPSLSFSVSLHRFPSLYRSLSQPIYVSLSRCLALSLSLLACGAWEAVTRCSVTGVNGCRASDGRDQWCVRAVECLFPSASVQARNPVPRTTLHKVTPNKQIGRAHV